MVVNFPDEYGVRKKLIIKTNNRYTPVIYGSELSDKWRKEFDFLNKKEFDDSHFFKYKNQIWYLGDFMRIDRNTVDFKGWDGQHSLTAFSGLVVKMSPDGEGVKVGYYY